PQPQVSILGDTEIPGEANECTSELPNGSTPEHNPADDEDDEAPTEDDEDPPFDDEEDYSAPPPEDKSSRGSGHGYPWGEREIGRVVGEYIYHDLKSAPRLKVVKR